jgi:hypothetical protein
VSPTNTFLAHQTFLAHLTFDAYLTFVATDFSCLPNCSCLLIFSCLLKALSRTKYDCSISIVYRTTMSKTEISFYFESPANKPLIFLSSLVAMAKSNTCLVGRDNWLLIPPWKCAFVKCLSHVFDSTWNTYDPVRPCGTTHAQCYHSTRGHNR